VGAWLPWFGNTEKKRVFLWYFARFALSLASPKVLSLEKTQKSFGYLLAYSYLCSPIMVLIKKIIG